MEQTVKCPICGEPYVVYAHCAEDQSACPDCRMRARRNRGEWKVDRTFQNFQIGYPINKPKKIGDIRNENYFSSSVTEIIDPQVNKIKCG